MITGSHLHRRRWPLWLLLFALLLLMLSILLMHRSYRAQIDASMAQLHQTVAAARIQQERLSARVQQARRSASPPPPGIAQDQPDRGQAPDAMPMSSGAESAGIAARLDRVADELKQVAGQIRPTPPGAGTWLDWTRIRKELRKLAHAIRQYRSTPPDRAKPGQTPLRLWLSRAIAAATQRDAEELAATLKTIQDKLELQSRIDPRAARLAKQVGTLRDAIGATAPARGQRDRLERLAAETKAISRLLLVAAETQTDKRPER